MTESDLYRRLYYKNKRQAFLQRIETSTGLGVPDLFVQVPGHSIWIELKIIRTSAWPAVPDWRPGQIGWALQYTQAGGRWVLIFYKNRKIYYSPYILREYTEDETFPFVSFMDHNLHFQSGRRLYERQMG